MAMNRDDLHTAVARIIADLADVPIDRVVLQAQLDDLDVDSITKIEMLGRLRKALHVSIPDDVAVNLTRVVDVVEYLSNLPVPADKP
jgi:acyl carrier protein